MNVSEMKKTTKIMDDKMETDKKNQKTSETELCGGHTVSQWIVKSTENFFQW
jgi:hypothetical protein